MAATASRAAAPLRVRVLADETITSTPLPGNGANPLWAFGAPMLVRQGGAVWTSILVTDAGAKPYCNTHWELWRRSASKAAWEKVRVGPAATEREPCPIALLDNDTLVLSANPKVMQRGSDAEGSRWWFCQPVLPAFAVNDPRDNDDVRLFAPAFPPGTTFRQHSYRGLAADPVARELLLLMIDGDDYQPTLRDAAGGWHPLPGLHFPIRACYPQVVLRDHFACALAIGDIVEPNQAWKEEKFRMLQREWDYAFRRLFYAWTPDVANGFGRPLELDSVEDTAGAMRNLDLLLDRAGRAHVLYFKQNIQYDFIRDRFFPGQAITASIEHVVIEGGRVVRREALLTKTSADGSSARRGFRGFGRLHELADGRMLALITLQGAASAAEPGVMTIRQVEPTGSLNAEPTRVRISGRAFAGQPFFTNTPRGGSAPGSHVDLLGAEGDDDTMTLRYVSLEIQ